jgi:hypothetical protein
MITKEELIEAFYEFATHKEGCPGGIACECGLMATRAAITISDRPLTQQQYERGAEIAAHYGLE